MTDAVTIAIISAVGSFAAAALSLANNIVGRRNTRNIATLEKNTNSIKDALVKVTGESEYAKGLKAGEDSKSTPG